MIINSDVKKIKIKIKTHIYKAVVEVKANQRGSHTHFGLECVKDAFPDDHA